MYSVTRSSIRSWKKSPIRFMTRAFSDKVDDPSILLREVMRNVAQPVAIAVTSVPTTSPLYGKAKYHGATLTSFTSLTLYPHPLVAFSLRLPSRMADCLRPYRTHGNHQRRGQSPQSQSQSTNIPSFTSTSIPNSNEKLQQEMMVNGSLDGLPNPIKGIKLPSKSELPWPLSKLPMPEQPPDWAKSLFEQIPNPLVDQSVNPLTTSSSPSSSRSTLTNPLSPTTTSSSSSASPSTPKKEIITSHPTPLTISLLSKSNELIADSLSLPRTDHSSIFALENKWIEHLSHPPSLKNSLGALQCEVVGSVLLKDLCGSADSRLEKEKEKGEGSELFICRVIGVDLPPVTPEGSEGIELKDEEQPLLHWRRKYVGIKEEDKEGIL